MAGQHYCLRWNNYQSNMTSVFHQLLCTEAFVDVTLACNDDTLKAHKVVLSACSSYFQKLLLDNPCRHPTIIMPQDVCFRDLKFIIEFVYKGEIDVSQSELQSLLKTADQLKIKGLCEVPEGNNGKDMVSAEVTPLPHPPPSSVLPRRHFNKLRKLSASARRKLDTRRLYREQLQKQHLEEERRIQQEQQQQQQQQAQMIQTVVTTLHESSQQHNQMQTSEPMANCITVATSTEDDHKSNIPVVILESRVPAQHQHPSPARHHHADAIMMTSPPPIMSTHAIPTTQIELDQTVNVNSIRGMCTAVEISPESTQQTTVPSATLIKIPNSPTHTDISVDTSLRSEDTDGVKVKFETLRAMDQSDLDMDSHISDRNLDEEPDHAMHTMMITPELLGLIPSSSVQTEINVDTNGMKRESTGLGSKTWTQEDMDAALEALRSHSMSLTKASITYGIPSTTLWQRAHRLGIDTPKKDGPAKSWTEDVLNVALEALRNGTISANKASKAYGIPSSTLYKIARREGIRLAAPFNAAPTTWNPEDLERALEAIRSGQTTVQRAATEYGIPSGTLYGRCKREGIELSRSNPTPWSEDAMTEALEAVRMGQMSINQAAIHYNLPYSSLYGRFKRCKYEADHPVESEDVGLAQHHTIPQQIMLVQYQQTPTQLQMYQHTQS